MNVSRVPRIIFFVMMILMAGLFLIKIFITLWFTRPLPNVSGQVALIDLSDTTEVYRDGYSIPHVLACNDTDVWHMQGFVTAQDRFFQMDYWRLFTQARLSEMMGPESARTDSFMSRFELLQTAEIINDRMSPELRKNYLAYVSGVNAYLNEYRKRLPMEYRILRYRPKPWTIEDCLSIYLGYALFTDLWDWRSIVIPAMGKSMNREEMQRLFPDTWNPISESMIDGSVFESFLKSLENVYREGFLPQGFSNGHCWVVPESLSLSHRPLLMIGLSADNALPCRFYEIHLHSPTVHAAGFSLPGFPFILFGYNASVAWGANKASYIPGSFQLKEALTSESLTQKINEENRILAVDSLGEHRLVFLWNDSADPGEVFFHLNRSRSAREAKEVLESLGVPSLHWICADTSEIVEFTKRKEANEQDRQDHRAISRTYFLSGWIRNHMNELVRRNSISVMDCQSIQTDNYSVLAEHLLPEMLTYFSDSSDSTCRYWVDKFSKWDRRMRIGDAEALVFETWVRQLAYQLWHENVNPYVFKTFMSSPALWQSALARWSLNPGKESADDTSDSLKTYQHILQISLVEAIHQIEKEQGNDFSRWSWGSVHKLTYRHPLSYHSSFQMSKSLGLKQPFVLGPYAQEGGFSSLSGGCTWDDARCIGTMARMIIDLDQLDNTVSILSTGQSGQIMDMHYQDQILLFNQNYYHPNLFDVKRIEQAGWSKVTAVRKNLK